MAGNYPDAPNHRIPYDRDGSSAFYIDSSGTVSALSDSVLSNWNDENPSSGTTYQTSSTWTIYWGVVFPEAMDLTDVAFNDPGGSDTAHDVIEFSTDTTNGLDGTWTSLGSTSTLSTANNKEGMRENINAIAAAGAKGIRIKIQKTSGAAQTLVALRTFHLYGAPAAAASRLRFWHPTLDEEVDGAYFDWGDTPRNAAGLQKTFRIKNPTALTANGVTLTTEALTDASPTNTSQHTFSDDGTNFSASLNVGNLSPGATSGVLTVQRDVPSNAALSLWWVRIIVSASSFS